LALPGRVAEPPACAGGADGVEKSRVKPSLGGGPGAGGGACAGGGARYGSTGGCARYGSAGGGAGGNENEPVASGKAPGGVAAPISGQAGAAGGEGCAGGRYVTGGTGGEVDPYCGEGGGGGDPH
jgi:hypothetical protein